MSETVCVKTCLCDSTTHETFLGLKNCFLLTDSCQLSRNNHKFITCKWLTVIHLETFTKIAKQ